MIWHPMKSCCHGLCLAVAEESLQQQLKEGHPGDPEHLVVQVIHYCLSRLEAASDQCPVTDQSFDQAECTA